ncbi:hypothetical protein D9M71_144200 [compost metagenome]
MAGLSIREAAIAAGCPEKSASQAGSRLAKHPNVLAHLTRLKQTESDTVPGSGRDIPPPGIDLGDEPFDDPKELLRAAMNSRLLDPKTRIQAAVALLPYEHIRLGEGGKKEQKQQAAADVVTGRFSRAAPPSPQMKLVK